MPLTSLLSRTGRENARLERIRAGVAGKVVAITGGARGIGFEVASELLDAGARVAIGDIDVDAVGKAAADLGIEGIELDVTSRESFENFLDAVAERVGPVDVLINNAGIMPVGPFLDYRESLIRATLDIDLLGVILGSQAAAARMVPRGRGQILNISSVAGRLPTPGLTVYNAAKAGVIEFSEALDSELSQSGVRVSTVMPTFTNTGLIDGLATNAMVTSVDADVIAREVLASIADVRLRVAAPRAMGWVNVYPVLPQPLKRAILRTTKSGEIFMNPDPESRSGYSKRIGQS
ncbi:SDR family oxidoreductase [Gordonia sp. (in: high G+C Gram-positive bacteria)]|uniref:SDR family oxidoreductase n=1 Tax=Gordonia sp. (in: high G+C Gram-positive bacteria) TaxID=84139 RepID=UPI0016A48473|nr:SDR family oxidoreductase [Gordonia sp. (in: high G+C Gram-positive bacteria)]NLG48122.1 SDR family oxidoreductase [Gordonia sp. (in: high G+C Gram-positive bacteria)]